MRKTKLRCKSSNGAGLTALCVAVCALTTACGNLDQFLTMAQASESPPARKVNAAKAAPEPNAKQDRPTADVKASEEGLDYSKFEPARKEPLRVPPAVFALCRPPSPAELKKQKERGPHFAPAVKFFANESALAELRSDKKSADKISTMPVGAKIVKEKWWDEKADKPIAYAAMIKREPGYDPKHGDWEYLYATLGDDAKIERGRIKSCIDCHATAEKRDYVFRNWLDDKAAHGAKSANSPLNNSTGKATIK